MAEDRPARPPPITRTLCEGITLPPTGLPYRESGREEILNFFGARERNARREHVEVALFHPRQKCAVRAHQRPQSFPAVVIDLADERYTFFVEAPGAFRFEFEQSLYAVCKRASQIVCTAAESREIFLRKIDAAHLEVGSHVANNIRQLKREAQAFGEIGIARVAKTKDVQARETHRSRYAVAILRKLVESRVGGDR